MSARKRKLPGRLYRVVRRLPWIEGGKPSPGGPGLWKGGKHVVYEPGVTAYIDDREAALIYHDLEAMDDAGRAILEEARARAEGPALITALGDLDQGTVDRLTDAQDEKRRVYGYQIERIWATNRDGTKELLSTRYVPTNPVPGVVYGDNGLPDPLATALQRERREMERKAQEQRSRGQRNARAKARRTETRDKAIAAYAVRLASLSDELADNPKQLANVLLERWKPEWGDPLAPSTVSRILKQQHVASTLRRR